MNEKQIYPHIKEVDEIISPNASGCKNVKEGTEWLSLCLCLTYGHVGCCNSSEGLHATRHFKMTRHPTMSALPN
jgi:hypothetical protein